MKTMLLIFSLSAISAFARLGSSLPQSLAVAAVIGEAGGESYTTQVAVACAIRNRGTLRGVYGVTNPVVKLADASLKAQARRAWKQSARRDIVKGATFFGCDADAPILMAYGLQPVCRSGAITFYKEGK